MTSKFFSDKKITINKQITQKISTPTPTPSPGCNAFIQWSLFIYFIPADYVPRRRVENRGGLFSIQKLGRNRCHWDRWGVFLCLLFHIGKIIVFLFYIFFGIDYYLSSASSDSNRCPPPFSYYEKSSSCYFIKKDAVSGDKAFVSRKKFGNFPFYCPSFGISNLDHLLL